MSDAIRAVIGAVMNAIFAVVHCGFLEKLLGAIIILTVCLGMCTVGLAFWGYFFWTLFSEGSAHALSGVFGCRFGFISLLLGFSLLHADIREDNPVYPQKDSRQPTD